MLASRAAAAAAVAVASAVLLSGCSEDPSRADPAPASTTQAALPDNLCEPVLAALSADWQLAEDSHSSEPPTAVCALRGPGDSSLRVTLTDFGDRAAAAAALDLVCRTAVGRPLGEDQRRCDQSSQRVPGRPFTATYAASYARTPSVVVVELATSDDSLALAAPAELAGVEAALQER